MAKTPHLNDLIAKRLSRRGVLGAMAAAPFVSLTSCASFRQAAQGGRAAGFTPVAATQADTVTVPQGYEVATLIAWGDPLFDSDAAPVDLDTMTRAQQEQRFGSHNDMLALFPTAWSFPEPHEGRTHILCANHEYFNPELAVPSVARLQDITPAQVETMMAGIGVSVMAVAQTSDGAWNVLRDARPGAGVNRRITPFTPVTFSGPAANHPWIVAAGQGFNAAESGGADGTIACGTLANCAGGRTPWGTYLTSEENFNSYFRAAGGETAALTAARQDARLIADAQSFGYDLDAGRSGLPGPAQYDLSANPTGPAVYGWVVEIDPYDPTSTPKKRTAIGRKSGENAATALTRDGRVAVYQGDDQLDEFAYKFVTEGRFDPANRAANMDLLDRGQLHVARFEEDGSGRWLPLTLEAANAAARAQGIAAFAAEADMLVRARVAARVLGATPLDRPEDVEAMVDDRWVGTGTVMIPCTKGLEEIAPRPGRPARDGVDGPQFNAPGHIIRIQEAGDDTGALSFAWDVFAMGGDPLAQDPIGVSPLGDRFPETVGVGGEATFTGAILANPDNLMFDRGGNVWITSDGMPDLYACNDVVLVASTDPSATPEMKRFMVAPVGAEICGPTLSPDERTFLASVQHPGGADADGRGFGRVRWSNPGSRPPSSFPAGGDAWPRSAVVYVRRNDGGLIGG